MKNNLHSLLLSSLVCCLALLGADTARAENPGETIITTIDRGIAVLQDPELKGLDKAVQRRDKLWEAVKELFDFKETAKRALGPHWNNLTEAQQDEFTDVFVSVLKNIYLSKSDTYAGEKIVFVREIISGDRGKVRTNLFISDEKKVVVDFSMQKSDGVWKTYDLQIEGVSIISNYRSQFNSFLSKNSFEKLMEDLIEKQKSL